MHLFNTLPYINLNLLIPCLLLLALTDVRTIDIQNHRNYKLLPKECGNIHTDKIIGGSQVPMGKFPWLVRLGYRLRKCVKDRIFYQCGGVLISDLYVVTAGHCVQDLQVIECPRNKENVRFELEDVLLGEYNSSSDPDCVNGVCAKRAQHFKPKLTFVHSGYNNPKYSHDITLIRLDKRAEINEWVSPICLPLGNLLTKFHTGKFAEVAGWGTTNISERQSSKVPMVVKVPILRLKNCSGAFIHPLNLSQDTQTCAGGEENKDSCGGDSGGPLMYISSDQGPPKYYAIGLVSFGVSHCGKKDRPAVYTRIAGFIEWILDHMSA